MAPSTHQKALELNLDTSTYGTFAEIGAGQEVARWFFRVGGAAGTVAKTLSAYDMKVSDRIYGKAPRYVSRPRLLAMLDHEFGLLEGQLGGPGSDKRLFAFADTVSARNYAGTNECHGWIGLRFQAEPGAAPSEVVLHVNLLDGTNLRQQEAIGVLGVNLLHAAYQARDLPGDLLGALLDDLDPGRLEVDLVELRGPRFGDPDGDDLALQVVRRGLSPAVLLDAAGRLATPGEVLRKRPLVIARRLPGSPHGDDGRWLAAGARHLAGELGEGERAPLPLLEIRLGSPGAPDGRADAVERQALRAALEAGGSVLLTRLDEAYELTAYLRRYSRAPLRFALGVSSLAHVLSAGRHARLPGGLLEAAGRLFADNVKLLAVPMGRAAVVEHLTALGLDGELPPLGSADPVTANDLPLRPPLDLLLRYLLEMGWVVPVAD